MVELKVEPYTEQALGLGADQDHLEPLGVAWLRCCQTVRGQFSEVVTSLPVSSTVVDCEVGRVRCGSNNITCPLATLPLA